MISRRLGLLVWFEAVVWLYVAATSLIDLAVDHRRGLTWALAVGILLAVLGLLVLRLGHRLQGRRTDHALGFDAWRRPIGHYAVWGIWCVAVAIVLLLIVPHVLVSAGYRADRGVMWWFATSENSPTAVLLAWSYACSLALPTLLAVRERLVGGDEGETLLALCLHLAYLPPALALILNGDLAPALVVVLLVPGLVGACVVHIWLGARFQEPESRPWIL